MTDGVSPPPPQARETVLAAAVGLHLAVMQFAHVFLLETRLTGRAAVYFTATLFWLLGLLAGLNSRPGASLAVRILVATSAYYIAWALLGFRPYRSELLPALGLCVAVSGHLAGVYFAGLADRGGPIRLLARENHGFVAGFLGCAVGSAFAGGFLLDWGPLCTGGLLLLVRRVSVSQG